MFLIGGKRYFMKLEEFVKNYIMCVLSVDIFKVISYIFNLF